MTALFSRIIHTIDTHTEGQPTRIVTAGLHAVPGSSMLEKRAHFREHLDHLRTLLLAEPRGHRDMYGCILTEPALAGADFGVMHIHNSGYMDMCGHATIGLTTALIETGMVTVKEPVTRIVYDSVGGLVTADALVEGGRVRHVTFENVPGYVHHLDATISVLGIGELNVDVAYGGNDFVWFDASEAGLEVGPDHAHEIVHTCMRVLAAANAQLSIRDAHGGGARSINIATALSIPHSKEEVAVRNVHVFGPGQFDRSPGGTGTTARLSVLRARGLIRLNEEVTIESGITDGRFCGVVRDEIELPDGRLGYVTTVRGSAHITGMHQFVVDPTDRFKDGFLIDDRSF